MIGVTVASVIALVVTVWQVGPRALYDQLRSIGPWFVIILAIEAVATVCDALVLHGFLGPGGRRPGFRRVVAAQIAGRAINVVTPMASLGEATKVTLLMRDTDAGRALATVVRFNVSFVAANLAFIVVGAPLCAALLPLPAWVARTLWIGTAIALVLGTGLAFMLRAGLVASLVHALRGLRIISRGKFDVWRARLRKLDATMRGEGGLRSWLPGLWTLPSKALIWVGAWLVLYANGQTPSVGVMAALASAGTLINLASNVVPLGLGVSEGGTAALMAALGESPALGVTIVVARRVVTLLYAAIGLMVLAVAQGRSLIGRPPA
jgi:uncharacterized membrane protein YbhN (UPF0104 family)